MNTKSPLLKKERCILSQLISIFLLVGCQSTGLDTVDAQTADQSNIFIIPPNIKSRAVSFENITGAETGVR